MYGNISERSDVGGEPGKSYLFFLTNSYPGIRLTGDRVIYLGKQIISDLSGAFSTTLEKLRESLIRTPGRTHTASGLQGEQPLVDRTMLVREVGKIDL